MENCLIYIRERRPWSHTRTVSCRVMEHSTCCKRYLLQPHPVSFRCLVALEMPRCYFSDAITQVLVDVYISRWHILRHVTCSFRLWISSSRSRDFAPLPKPWIPVGVRMAVWRSDSVVRRMNEVALRWAQLVLGWATVFGRVFHLGM